MADSTPKSYSTDPTLWLYTSLSSGSSQIVTATSRLETILKANKIQFQALDVATDEKARMLWGRRAGKRKLPGLVRMGMVVGDINEIEEWNEYGELREQVDSVAPATTTPATSTSNTPSKPPIAASTSSSTSTPVKNPPAVTFAENIPPKQQQSAESISKPSAGGAETSFSLAMRQAGKEAAEKAKLKPKSTNAKVSPAPGGDFSKLDNSAPTGVPPPSGVTEAASAIAPETGSADVVSKADDVPPTSTNSARGGINDATASSTVSTTGAGTPQKYTTAEVIDSSLGDLKPTESTQSVTASALEASLPSPVGGMAKHRGSSISVASKDEIKEVEEAIKIEEEPEEEEEAVEEVDDKFKPAETKTEEDYQHKDDHPEKPHVEFTGEAKGDELDRIKATLAKDVSPNNRIGTEEASIIAQDTASKKAQEIHQGSPTQPPQEQKAAEPEKATESVAD